MTIDLFEPVYRKIILPHHSVIDVTLRDGGFRNNFSWTEELAKEIVRASFSSGANYCEIGYVGGVPELHNVINTSGHACLCLDYINILRDCDPYSENGGRFSVMVHPGAKMPRPAFKDLKSVGVGLIRIVFHPSWEHLIAPLINEARHAGLMVAINIALVSRYEPDELFAVIEEVLELSADIIYFADTCGSLLPNEVVDLVSAVAPSMQVGFHAHDYLSLAIANSLSALNSGASWIDTSIWGMGRGAGNARTEIWAGLRMRSTRLNVDFNKIATVMLRMSNEMGIPKIPDWISVASGLANLTPPHEDYIRSSGSPDKFASEICEKILQNL